MRQMATKISLGLILFGLVPSVLGLSAAALSQVNSALRACQLLKEAFPQLVAFPGMVLFIRDLTHSPFADMFILVRGALSKALSSLKRTSNIGHPRVPKMRHAR